MQLFMCTIKDLQMARATIQAYLFFESIKTKLGCKLFIGVEVVMRILANQETFSWKGDSFFWNVFSPT